VAALILLLHGNAVPGWGWYIVAHLLCLVLVHRLIGASAAQPANRLLDFLRHFYPVLLYTGFYRETAALNQMVHTGYLDPFFQRLDRQIFGFDPCFRFMEVLPCRLVSEVFHAAYFSYYVMIVGVGLALFLRNRTQFHHYISVTSFVFYVCYLAYIFLPVVGPRIYYPDAGGPLLAAADLPAVVPAFPAAVQAGWFHGIMEVIYKNFESPGAAFPSSHVAVALVTVYFSFLYLPRIRWPHLVMAVLLCLATVYCRYHFAVDVVAGIVTGAVLLPLGNRLHARFNGSRREKVP
jgi:membrane-associated phospholipid phosphatase